LLLTNKAPFGTVRTQQKSFNKDMSIGMDCLVRTQTEVLKGFVAQVERTCLTLSDKSFALKAFSKNVFLSDLASRILNLGKQLWKDDHQNDGLQF
jgi:hypothetical protein